MLKVLLVDSLDSVLLALGPWLIFNNVDTNQWPVLLLRNVWPLTDSQFQQNGHYTGTYWCLRTHPVQTTPSCYWDERNIVTLEWKHTEICEKFAEVKNEMGSSCYFLLLL